MGRDDDGRTLIELLIVVVMLGIIIAPLAEFVMAYMKNTTTTEDRLSDSHDIQIATAYFSQDVANIGMRAAISPYGFSQSVWNHDVPAGSCGSGAGTTKLLLRWDAWTVTPTQTGRFTGTSSSPGVAYVVEGTTLHRIFCSDGTTTSADAVLVHGLKSVAATCPNNPTPTDCNLTSSVPDQIDLTLGIATGDKDKASPDNVVLTGERRQT